MYVQVLWAFLQYWTSFGGHILWWHLELIPGAGWASVALIHYFQFLLTGLRFWMQCSLDQVLQEGPSVTVISLVSLIIQDPQHIDTVIPHIISHVSARHLRSSTTPSLALQADHQNALHWLRFPTYCTHCLELCNHRHSSQLLTKHIYI